VLLGRAYWSGLVDWLRDTMLAEGKIAERDLDLFQITDDPDEAVRIIVGSDDAGDTDTETDRTRIEREAAEQGAADRIRADRSGSSRDVRG
jgi:hypothetical protein